MSGGSLSFGGSRRYQLSMAFSMLGWNWHVITAWSVVNLPACPMARWTRCHISALCLLRRRSSCPSPSSIFSRSWTASSSLACVSASSCRISRRVGSDVVCCGAGDFCAARVRVSASARGWYLFSRYALASLRSSVGAPVGAVVDVVVATAFSGEGSPRREELLMVGWARSEPGEVIRDL